MSFGCGAIPLGAIALIGAGWWLTASPSSTMHLRMIEDTASRAGVRFVLRNSATPEKHQIETMAGGVAVFDYNGDGKADIYFSNGASIPELKKSDPKFWNRLYRN